ncbi:hypothetical protein FLM9_1481 [Candidatus Synechococcus spongiarum]|uniref:Uncharacterized protein n=1 Tax=Candidatus Synechococcus spongiarum TaxID=431041 RepID=A0A164Y6D0_9SYNE|nr:hypothetical protein FLM9_1481 [Candidatus Synechococcus spongiarum]
MVLLEGQPYSSSPPLNLLSPKRPIPLSFLPVAPLAGLAGAGSPIPMASASPPLSSDGCTP